MRKLLGASCGMILAASMSSPVLAVDSSYTATSASSPEAVWAKVGDFCGISKWMSGLTCSLSSDGKVRTLTTGDGGTVVEQLDSRDDGGRTYSYTILSSGPLPVANYHSKIMVVPAGSGATIVWTGTYDAKGASDADAKKVIDGIYKAGADSLAK